MEDSGVFAAIAENRGGTAKCSANLVVEEKKEKRKSMMIPPSFTSTLQDITTKPGELVKFEAKVIGMDPLEVYWLKVNKVLFEN